MFFISTLEPGPVVGVEGHCSVVVWNEPEQPNGVIINYALLFYLNTGNDSGVLIETEDITTNFVIKSSNQLSLIPDDMDVGLFVKVPVCCVQLLRGIHFPLCALCFRQLVGFCSCAVFD